MYEIPVKIYNASNSSKRFTLKEPKTKKFRYKYDFDNKNKNCHIAPGLYLEILIIFEAEELGDYEDKIDIISENNFTLELKLSAKKAKPMINFEPFINLGFVPTNSKREEYIEFVNEGYVETAVELKLNDKSNTELTIETDRIELGRRLREGEKEENREKKPNRRLVKITYE